MFGGMIRAYFTMRGEQYFSSSFFAPICELKLLMDTYDSRYFFIIHFLH